VSDLRQGETVLAGADSLYQQLVLVAAKACEAWAEIMFDGLEALLLWPKDRGDFPHGVPYRISSQTVRLGAWRVTLQPQLPAGVDLSTRDAMLKAEIALSAKLMPITAVDQVVQCGLFGEVLYR
jgi:hypothetical protein